MLGSSDGGVNLGLLGPPKSRFLGSNLAFFGFFSDFWAKNSILEVSAADFAFLERKPPAGLIGGPF